MIEEPEDLEHGGAAMEDAEEEMEESSSSEEEDEEEEEPPILKYTKITQLPKSFFNTELVTATHFHDSLFAFGTSSGLIYMTNSTNFKQLKSIRARKSPILSIDSDGEYIAAVSIDGTIIVSSVASQVAYDIKVPIYSIAIVGKYKDTKSFIYGKKNGEVVFSYINWIGTRLEKKLAKENSSIVGMKIIGKIVVWCSDDGVCFFNLVNNEVVLRLKKPGEFISEVYWPKFAMQEHDLVLIGWFNKIWSVKVEQENPNGNDFVISSAMSTFKQYEVNIEIKNEMEVENGIIYGIESFRNDELLLLLSDNDKLELKIVNFNHEIISNDEIVVKEKVNLNELSINKHLNSKKTDYYLISNNFGLKINELELVDKYNWYINNQEYLKAYEISESIISKVDRCNIGLKEAEKCFDGDWNKLKLLPTILKYDDEIQEYLQDEWEKLAKLVLKHGKYNLLAEVLPCDPRFKISKKLYNNCLIELLNSNDQDVFYKTLNNWDGLYDYDVLEEKLTDKVAQSQDYKTFKRCLVEVLIKNNKPEECVKYMIELNDDNTIDLIVKYHLINELVANLMEVVFIYIPGFTNELEIETVEDKLSKLFKFLIEIRNEIKMSEIVTKFGNYSKLTYILFKWLNVLEPKLVDEYEMIELMSQYEPKNLLDFLKTHSNYNSEKVLRLMKQHDFKYEIIYLLNKIGKYQELIEKIIEIDDEEYGINFVKKSKNSKLIELLINSSIKKSNFIKRIIEDSELIQFNNLILFKKIPNDIEIPGLKQSLIKISVNNQITVVIQSVVLKIIENESIENSNTLNNFRITGKVFDA